MKDLCLILKSSLFLGVALLGAACSKAPSEDVKTSSIHAAFEVKAISASDVECVATFQVGGPTGTFLELSGDDKVRCNGQEMTKSEFLGIITYHAQSTTPFGGVHRMAFSRTDENYEAAITVPEAIFNPSPAAHAVFQKGQVLPVSWTAAADPSVSMEASLSFDYLVGGETKHATRWSRDSAPENGQLAFSPSDTTVNPPSPGNWSAQVTLRREKAASMPTGLSGHAAGTRSVSIPITLID